MNYAFVSMLIPDGMASELFSASKRNMQDAANALQWHIYNGLCQNLNTNISLINTLPVGSFPQYCTQARIRRSTFATQYGEDNVNIGFLNIKLIRKISQSHKLYAQLKQWAAKTPGPKTIFVYTASGVFLKAAAKVRRKYPEVIICDIIADLPGLTSLSSRKSTIQKIAAKKNKQDADIWMNHVDYFVLLTKQMAQYLNIQKPFCVMEGIATGCDAPEKEKSPIEDEIKTIFYSGTLHRKFGVLTLLKAFHEIPKENYRLQICGVGDSEAEILQAAAEDKRIEYMGRVPRDRVLELQKKATVLVNPRPNSEELQLPFQKPRIPIIRNTDDWV